MLSYPCNSPEAAGRLLALVMIADGHVFRSEFDALERIDAEASLGLAPGAMAGLVQALCQDLLTGLCVAGTLHESIDDDTLAALMAEVTDPVLQRRVLALAHAAAEGDGHLAQAEAFILAAARRHWAPAAAPAADRAEPALA